jgi:hypothetical protein
MPYGRTNFIFYLYIININHLINLQSKISTARKHSAGPREIDDETGYFVCITYEPDRYLNQEQDSIIK